MAQVAGLLLLTALALAIFALGATALDTSTGSAAQQQDLVVPPEYIPDTSQVVRLAWRPRAFLFPNFLSEAECDYIVNYSTPRMERSTVVGANGGSVVDNIRTSYGTFIDKYIDPVVKRIEERVAAWTFLPLENQEAMQVLRYNNGQKYGAHYDYYEDKASQTGGPRYATVLMYLSTPEFGGETVFPNSEPDTVVKDDTWSECGKKGVAVKARKGDALLFFSMKPDGSFDSASMHSGCPVLKGEKWSATKWIHSGNFDPPFRDPKICQDDDEHCAGWAASGECSRNPKYMVGTGNGPLTMGYCRKSCGVCLDDAQKAELRTQQGGTEAV